MDLALSAQHQEFAASLHDLLGAANGPAAARAWGSGDRKPGLEIWRSLAETGVTGLMVPERHGGAGADAVDLVVACEEIGHHAVPGPVAESVAAAPVLLAGLGGGPWLGPLASGELIATIAAPPLLPLAADADAAQLVLFVGSSAMIRKDLTARDRQIFPDHERAVRLGIAGPPIRSLDPARSLAEVSPGELIAAGQPAAAAVSAALEYGTLACAAQLLGAGRALLEAAATHARQRIQFGQPVGGFQAVKHHLADVLIGLEFARPLLFGAAVALAADSCPVFGKQEAPATASAGADSCPVFGKQEAPATASARADSAGLVSPAARRDVSAAKVACAEAANRAARVALQVHGAIGYTAEHDVSLYLTKVQALAPSWGSQAQHRSRVLAVLTGAGE
jgi:alkylation response protein AidB-like acyl-CoA dehydrogenase